MTFPIAIDYNHGAPTYERHSLPLPPVPEGWTRLIAADWSSGDKWVRHEAVTEPRIVPARIEIRPVFTAVTTDAEGNPLPIQYEPVEIEPERIETITIVPAWDEQVASGVCIEYERRAKEYAASLPTPDDTEQRRSALLADLAAKRYSLEVGGFDYMGKRVMSDRESQAKIQGLMVGVQLLGDGFRTAWKCEGGQWLSLDKQGALGLVGAALTHVSRLYEGEAILSDLIRSTTDLDSMRAEVEAFK